LGGAYKRVILNLMYRQLLTIFIFLLLTSDILGQVQNDVKKVLDSSNFVAFKKYADKLSNREKRISSHWECLRDLTANFKEGVFIFEKSVPDKDNPAISSVYTFRVTLITTDKSIVYYELSEEKNKKVGNDWESYYDPINKFKDKKLFDSLQNSFKRIFQSTLNENELFITDFVYGKHCGLAGVDTKGRQQIDEWVTNKNKTELLKWLKSTNTEKQIYAVDGLYQLKKVGTKLTSEEMKMINFVTKKSGTIYVCSGCIHSQDDIISVTKEFKF
jgi:hypothetical protein